MAEEENISQVEASLDDGKLHSFDDRNGGGELKELLHAVAKTVEHQGKMIEELRSLRESPQSSLSSDQVDEELRKLDQQFLASPTTVLAKALKNFEEQLLPKVLDSIKSTSFAENFWADFMDDYPEMNGFEDVLKRVVSEDQATLAKIGSKRKMKDYIYKKARKMIEDRFSEMRKRSSSSQQSPIPLNPPSFMWPSSNTKAKEEDESSKSLADSLKEIRKKMYYG